MAPPVQTATTRLDAEIVNAGNAIAAQPTRRSQVLSSFGPLGMDGFSLRAALLTALAILLLVALFAVATVLLAWLPTGPTPATLMVGVIALVLLDVLVVLMLGDYLLQRMLVQPVARMVVEAESIAAGDTSRRLEEHGPEELGWLARSVNRMTDRLISNQKTLAENIRSLDRTNAELNETRRELLHAEKLASVGRLAAGVAHEVGNPLGAILGYVEVARRRGSGDEDLLADIQGEAERIDGVVRGLLDFARPGVTTRRPIVADELVEATVDRVVRQGRFKGLELSVDLRAPGETISADLGQLEQVFVNLLLNAAEAIEETGTTGTVLVTTAIDTYESPSMLEPQRRREDPDGVDYSHLRSFRSDLRPRPRLSRGSRIVRIEVADDGAGISEEDVDRIFEPFFTTKDPGRGTGLGLAVCARLIEGMGGVIDAEPRADGGTRFIIQLPCTGEERKST